LQLLGGLDAPTDGSIMLAGQNLGSLSEVERTVLRRSRIGFVFQSFNLVPVLTAVENVGLPLTLAGIRTAEVTERSHRALRLVGLDDRAQHLPAELSGGEQQRVAVARALVTEPALLLADEPTGNLDSRTSAEVMSLIRRSATDLGQTVLLVTHDPRAAAYDDRLLFLRDGQVADEWRRPAQPQSAAETAAAILAKLEQLETLEAEGVATHA
ncbi:MAG: ABC transporter ATP-binding protein, partial [Mycobacterium leprae]